jgi:beta-phosphoglucomutase-like phosphatase (HAD superfamily)
VTGHLARTGLLPSFTTVVCRDDVQAGKPAPDLYLTALSRLGISAEDAIAVEDSATGVAAARAAGVSCVAVLGPATVDHDISAADLQLSTLSGVRLPDLLAHTRAAFA